MTKNIPNRDKFLSEAMDEDWHEWQGESSGTCSCITWKANNISYGEFWQQHGRHNIDFSEWGGFGKLWEWSQEQDWFNEFQRTRLHHHSQNSIGIGYVNPEWFANTVYEYLKEKNIEPKK